MDHKLICGRLKKLIRVVTQGLKNLLALLNSKKSITPQNRTAKKQTALANQKSQQFTENDWVINQPYVKNIFF